VGNRSYKSSTKHIPMQAIISPRTRAYLKPSDKSARTRAYPKASDHIFTQPSISQGKRSYLHATEHIPRQAIISSRNRAYPKPNNHICTHPSISQAKQSYLHVSKHIHNSTSQKSITTPTTKKTSIQISNLKR